MSLPIQSPALGLPTNGTPYRQSMSVPQQEPIPLEPISIQDLESGKIDLDALIAEVQQLRSKIPELRYEMCKYLQIMSSVDESTVPGSFYSEVASQVTAIQSTLESYYEEYRRLLPVIRYSKAHNGLNPDDSISFNRHDVAVDSRLVQDQPTPQSGGRPTPTSQPVARRTSSTPGGRRKSKK